MKGKKLAGVSFKECVAVCDSRGIFCPSYDEKSTLDLPADAVILAIGQKTDMGMLDPALHGPAGVRCHPITLQTAKSKIFAAGDFLRGPKTIVEAMAQGKEAADEGFVLIRRHGNHSSHSILVASLGRGVFITNMRSASWLSLIQR